MKPVRVILSQEAQEAYAGLEAREHNSKVESSILRSIDEKKKLIKANPHYGEPNAQCLYTTMHIY